MAEKVKIRMIGNYQGYDNGEEYSVPVDVANQFTGIGVAVLVVEEPAPDEE